MNLATGRTGGWIWLIFSCLYLNGALALNLKQAGSVILLSLPDNWIQDNILNPCFPSSWVNADSETFRGYVFGTELPSCIVLYAIVTVPFLIKFRSLPSISTLSLFSLVSYGCVIAGFCVDAVMRFKGGEGGGDDDGDDDGDEEGDDFAGDGDGFVEGKLFYFLCYNRALYISEMVYFYV